VAQGRVYWHAVINILIYIPGLMKYMEFLKEMRTVFHCVNYFNP